MSSKASILSKTIWGIALLVKLGLRANATSGALENSKLRLLNFKKVIEGNHPENILQAQVYPNRFPNTFLNDCKKVVG